MTIMQINHRIPAHPSLFIGIVLCWLTRFRESNLIEYMLSKNLSHSYS